MRSEEQLLTALLPCNSTPNPKMGGPPQEWVVLQDESIGHVETRPLETQYQHLCIKTSRGRQNAGPFWGHRFEGITPASPPNMFPCGVPLRHKQKNTYCWQPPDPDRSTLKGSCSKLPQCDETHMFWNAFYKIVILRR